MRRQLISRAPFVRHGFLFDKYKLLYCACHDNHIFLLGFISVFVDALNANTDFGDRLAAFWFDHFCVKPVHAERIPLMIAYMQQILRNRMMGTFYNLLEGAIKHPSMLLFLNQDQASGPNSPHQKAAGTRLPANENLARELLELHTLGAGNGYTQQDVAQTALLLTGLRYTHWTGFQYNTHFAEPGVKTIMGVRYNPNSAVPSVDHINAFLRNLANNPRTIDTICRKLLVHFVSDSVDTIMLDAMKAEWVRTGGNLRAVYTVMLNHPRVHNTRKLKVKRPLDFVISSFRAISLPGSAVQDLKNWQYLDWIYSPLLLMGQALYNVPGPNGWPEDDQSWITPAGYATRIEWANNVPARITGTIGLALPAPATLAQRALGHYASAELNTAVPRAASRKESKTVLLASNDFNRR